MVAHPVAKHRYYWEVESSKDKPSQPARMLIRV